MSMRYFQSGGSTYGYDTSVETDAPLIAAAVAANWTEVTGNWPPAPTAQQVAAQAATAALSGGIVLTCTSNAALNATYSCTIDTKVNILGILGYLNIRGGFISGGPTMNWYDVSGSPHAFTVSQFTEFAEAVGAFVEAVEDYGISGTGSLPSSAITIQ